MPNKDCNKIEKGLDELQENIDSGLKQEKEFQEAYAHEIQEIEKLEEEVDDHITIEEDGINYDDVEGEADRLKTEINDLELKIQNLDNQESSLFAKRGILTDKMFSNLGLINDYQAEADLFDCDKEPNKSFADCIFLNDILKSLRADQDEWQQQLDDIDDRLLEISEKIEEAEKKISDKEELLNSLKDELKHEEKEKDLEKKRTDLNENKKLNFPDAWDLPTNQGKKDKLLRDLAAHCWND